MKGKRCLTTLTAVCDDRTSSEDEGRAVDVGYRDFCKAISQTSDEVWAARWAGNELCCQNELGTGWLESSFAEQVLGLLTDAKLPASQQRVCMAKEATELH